MVCSIDHCQQSNTKGGLRVIFQIPKFLRVPESRVVGEHFGLLFGSGTRDPGELRVTKVYITGFPLLFPFMEFSLKMAGVRRVFASQIQRLFSGFENLQYRYKRSLKLKSGAL